MEEKHGDVRFSEFLRRLVTDYIKELFSPALLYIQGKNGEIIASEQLGKLTIHASNLETWLIEREVDEKKVHIPVHIMLSDKKWEGHLGLVTFNEERSQKESSLLLKGFICGLNANDTYRDISVEKERQSSLLRLSETLHSTMNIQEIISELLRGLDEAYPAFHIDLLISHDWQLDHVLPIKSLDFQKSGDSDLALKAYLTGDIQCEEMERKHTFYIPLNGKQGTYGVFQMTAPGQERLSDTDLEFLRTLSNTGGNTIEKAELYDQSRQYITDLQLINKTSQQLNSKLKLKELIPVIVKQMKQSFHADEVGFIVWKEDGDDRVRAEVMDGSTDFFKTKEFDQWIPPLSTYLSDHKDGMLKGDVQSDSVMSRYRSIMAVPMMQDDTMIGFVVITGDNPYAFNFDTFKLFQSLVHHSTLAFVNSILHEELEKSVVTDYLTNLYTRAYLDEKVTASLAEDYSGSFILLDIDRFKEINDQFGHQTGDRVILQVAKAVRKSINSENDIAARWGGEELAIYMRNTDLERARSVAEKIRQFVEHETNPVVTISAGVSHWKRAGSDIDLNKLFHTADKGMYEAKENGRNQVFTVRSE